MRLLWTFDTVTGTNTGWIHPDGPQHIYQDSLGDRYCIQRSRRNTNMTTPADRNGSDYYTVSLTRWRAAGARVGQFDSLDEAKAAAETHADTLVVA